MTDKSWKLVSFLLLFSGIGSAAVLAAHVMIGGILDPRYNQTANSISALTQTGAPNQEILQPLLSIYAGLYIVFSVLLVILLRKKANRIMSIGYQGNKTPTSFTGYRRSSWSRLSDSCGI